MSGFQLLVMRETAEPQNSANSAVYVGLRLVRCGDQTACAPVVLPAPAVPVGTDEVGVGLICGYQSRVAV